MPSFFAQPWALWLLPAVTVLSILFWIAERRRRKILARLGNPFLVQSLAKVWRMGRSLRSLCWCIGLTLLAVAVAGPQWGRVWNGNTLTQSGRDVVVVLDLSRSMTAEQPSRQSRAKKALRDLADAMQQRGGHRVALVVFAARPTVVFPLTNDYDHLRHALVAQDAENLPPEMRAAFIGEVSGTRIGAAIATAVQLHDERFSGAQDVLLLSDGDDPAKDDEWLSGVNAARKRNIPVHVVAIGDPKSAAEIPYGDGFVNTSLDEKPLQEIARITKGVYFPAHDKALPLGELYRETIEPGGVREESEVESIAHLVVFKQRYGWFAAAALFFIGMAMWIPEQKTKSCFGNTRIAYAMLAAGCVTLVSAAPASQNGDWLRRGNEDYFNGKYPSALDSYEKASQRARDPGRVAFNTAAALYRSMQYDAAMRYFQRCLEDDSIPILRKAKAWFNLGNCLLQQKDQGGKPILDHAQRCFEACLDVADIPDSLRRDARYNLELARLLWLEAKDLPQPQPPKTKNDPGGNSDKKNPEPKQNGAKQPKDGKGLNASQKNPNAKAGGLEKQFAETKKKLAALPKLHSLPDADKLTPLTQRETSSFLQDTISRIDRSRRSYREQAVPFSKEVKDW